jgi:predicted nuclease of predicted toxin-antitoxin system
MPSPDDRIRFRLDEHVDPSIARALRRAGIDVTTTNEVGLRSADDQTHFQFACAEGRVIVTRDTDFLRFGREDSDHPGIVFYSAHDSLREIIEGLILIYEVLDPGEMCGHIEYL